MRDVLAQWAQLVVAAEKELGIDLAEQEIKVPERVPGYTSALIPRGNKPSHLDDTPLTPEESIDTSSWAG